MYTSKCIFSFPDNGIKMSHESSILPSITSTINNADKIKKEEFTRHQFQNPYSFENVEIKEEVINVDMSNVEHNSVEVKPDIKELNRVNRKYEFMQTSSKTISGDQLFGSGDEANSVTEEKPVVREETIKMIKKHHEFIQASRSITTDQFLVAAAQLCHMDTSLAEHVWLSLFPKLWAILEEDQRSVS